jgi:hypothetical protein
VAPGPAAAARSVLLVHIKFQDSLLDGRVDAEEFRRRFVLVVQMVGLVSRWWD